MARPVNADPSATRQRILEAACELMAGDGPGDFSTREVARRAGLSVGTVHHYFDSKAELISACLAEYYDQLESLRAEAAASLAGGAPIAEVIERSTRRGFDLARENRAFARMLMLKVVEEGQPDAERQKTREMPLLEMLGRLLAPALGVSESEVRLRAKTIIQATGDYAITTDEALARLVTEADRDRVVELVRDHLGALARALLTNDRSR